MSEYDFSTCEVSDALIKLGSPHGGHIPDIHLQSPSPPNSKFCVYGPAYTVKMVPISDETAPELSAHYLETAPPKSIVVIDAPAQTKSAVWGRLMTVGAQTRDVAGVVVSGRCRDLSEHRAAGFPVFARGHSTIGQSPFLRSAAVDVPLVISPQNNLDTFAFDEVTVKPGDWIFADENGVVCVPKDLLDEMVEQVKYGRECEARAIVDIKAGKGALKSLMLHDCMPKRIKPVSQVH